MHPIVFQPVVYPLPIADDVTEELSLPVVPLDVWLDDPTLDIGKLELL